MKNIEKNPKLFLVPNDLKNIQLNKIPYSSTRTFTQETNVMKNFMDNINPIYKDYTQYNMEPLNYIYKILQNIKKFNTVIN